MNLEESRIRSFSTWPINAPVHPRQLTVCGFFATGNFLEAECNWCHLRISDWEYGDEVEQRHILANPICEFITNRNECGNVPFQSSTNQLSQPQQSVDSETTACTIPASTAKEDQPLDLMIETNRLATFKNWPNPNISPQSLAKAGFFYLNRSDEVKCAWCKGVIAQWEKQDNAFNEHRRFFPDCPRVQLGPLIEIVYDGIRDLGIQQIMPPKNPKYSSLDARLRTYSNWPIPDVQRPEGLAHAGLYYQEVDDQVRCFHCNMGLRSWEKEDDPWFEHAKWYPMCQFVRLVKGVKYIQEVQDLTRSAQSSNAQTVPAMTIDEAMVTAPVRLALEMGVDGGAIRNKTQLQLMLTGSPYATVEDLLKAVFDEGVNDEPNVHAEHIHQTLGGDCTGSATNNLNANVANRSSVVSSDIARDAPSNETDEHSDGAEGFAINREIASPNLHQVDDKILTENAVSKFNFTEKDFSSTCLKENEILTSDSLSLKEENRKLKDARLCKVCLDEEVGVVYLPCGHLVTCVQCAPGVTQCPMCRTTIKGFVRTYLS